MSYYREKVEVVVNRDTCFKFAAHSENGLVNPLGSLSLLYLQSLWLQLCLGNVLQGGESGGTSSG